LKAIHRTPTIPGRRDTPPYAGTRFERAFPDEAACLEWLKQYVYPDGIVCRNKGCERYGQVIKHHRVLSRRSYSCAACGRHVHPTADTIFHKSPTPLRQWFYAIHLMAATECEIPAREIQRLLGVTYKTAWRICHQIRPLFERAAPGRRPEDRRGIGIAIARFVDAQAFESLAAR